MCTDPLYSEETENTSKRILSSPLSTPQCGKRTRRLCIINSRSSSADPDAYERIFRRFGSPTHPANIEIRALQAKKAALAKLAKEKARVESLTISSPLRMPGMF